MGALSTTIFLDADRGFGSCRSSELEDSSSSVAASFSPGLGGLDEAATVGGNGSVGCLR